MNKGSTVQIIEFAKLLHAVQRVERAVRVPGTDRKENDAEHSYSLAMLAWYIADTRDLKLNKQKIFEYALAHDIVEVYAGDTPAFSKQAGIHSSKKEREAASLARIRSEFPDFDSLYASMAAYESQADEEARFVYALDKLMPIFLGFAQDGRDWKDNGISFEDVFTYKLDKIKAHDGAKAIFEDMMAIMAKDKARYFNK
jgi:putative hydrolase of HD superfamily